MQDLETTLKVMGVIVHGLIDHRAKIISVMAESDGSADIHVWSKTYQNLLDWGNAYGLDPIIETKMFGGSLRCELAYSYSGARIFTILPPEKEAELREAV